MQHWDERKVETPGNVLLQQHLTTTTTTCNTLLQYVEPQENYCNNKVTTTATSTENILQHPERTIATRERGEPESSPEP
jgi:ABC-type tungstate transport system permease subunit